MSKNLLKKTLVLGIIILFIGTIITPSISGNVSKINDIKSVKTRDINNAIQTKERKPHTTSTTDWWPMFRRCSGNAACSKSIAPNTNQLCWNDTISDEIYFSAPIISNDRLYISTGWWFFYYFDMLEPPKITEKSMFEAPDFTKILNDLTTYNDEYDGGVYCLNADKGTKLWDYSLYAPNDPLIVDNNVYVTDLDIYSYDSSLYCLNAETGNLNWAKPAGGLVLTPTIGANNKIFVGVLDYYTYGGSLKCFDFDGNSDWTYQLPPNEIIWFSAPAYCDDKVYFITVDMYSYLQGKVYCLDANTGQYIWSQPIYTLFFFYFYPPSPACKDGKVFAVEFNIFSYISSLKCFDADTGTPLWQYNLGSSICFGIPAVSQDSAFIATTDFYTDLSWLYRISTNGALVWKVMVPGYTYFFSSSSPVCSVNKVIVSPWDYYGYGSAIYCMEIENGNKLWNYSFDYMSLTYPSIADERVYIADLNGNIYAFEDALKINKVSGGILCAKAVIKNEGESDLSNISWEIDVVGGIFKIINKHADGNIPTLEGGKSKTVRAFPVFGLGNVEIEVIVSMPGIITPIKKSLNGLVLGLIVIVKS